MNVLVYPHQTGPLQQSNIMQNRERSTLARDAAAFEHVTAVGNILQSVQIVRCRDDRFRAVFPGGQQIDDLGLAERVERRAGLIKKNHFRVRN